MRFTAQLFCLAASLAAAPAFAQGGKDSGPVSTAPQALGQAPKAGLTSTDQPSPQLNLGFGINRGGTERTLLPVAPIQKDELALSWKPTNNWGVTLDLTTRSQNQLFPREEMSAGVTYQVTPRFRFGGGVTVKGNSLAESLSSPATNFARDKADTEASVKIESAFSF
jgi:hypothetical protein